ncbi:MAG TPA: hypothetical protein VL442_01080 [Mucilaginibacter sp.]|nr:hypothetical protein [Mucilaginibacter sp.]
MKLLQKKTQLITAASELMTNMIKYANGGEVEIQAFNMGRKKSLSFSPIKALVFQTSI